ncbi:winged helix-turn-helix domain-containing protein [Limibacter armeniacum]|uniref:winged helix-turn-helix domain-containing protein n=1 Tax=Limibacter armeniacum TaxID=466084 RepID=UPI002FE57979
MSLVVRIFTPGDVPQNKKGKYQKPRNFHQNSYHIFYGYVNKHNEKFDYETRKLKIRGGLLATLRALNQRFLTIYEASTTHGKMRYKEPEIDHGWFETSNALLGNATHQSPRTVARHIQRLVEMGVIEKKRIGCEQYHNYSIKLCDDLIRDVIQFAEAELEVRRELELDGPLNKEQEERILDKTETKAKTHFPELNEHTEKDERSIENVVNKLASRMLINRRE